MLTSRSCRVVSVSVLRDGRRLQPAIEDGLIGPKQAGVLVILTSLKDLFC